MFTKCLLKQQVVGVMNDRKTEIHTDTILKIVLVNL